MTNSKDVVFGATMAMRPAAAGTGEATGPIMATIPMRIKLNSKKRVLEHLKTVQQQATDMIPFEKANVEQIGKICSEARAACIVPDTVCDPGAGKRGYRE